MSHILKPQIEIALKYSEWGQSKWDLTHYALFSIYKQILEASYANLQKQTIIDSF